MRTAIGQKPLVSIQLMRYAHPWPWPLATLREWPRCLRCEQLSAISQSLGQKAKAHG
ncbi:MAG: hypothetical protein F6J90_13860 [Moorea sp. SIOASIH]|uniref:hypothetical protein n=1 Tax=Moorena sp. SIOASIH TaxID=2607817 RepID=UPI0013BD3077|nr:hypothetical protein [Moorena sp. SIOASIH]NEO37350.1 hypothetical protein [Moorena sp. SIOASIH]